MLRVVGWGSGPVQFKTKSQEWAGAVPDQESWGSRQAQPDIIHRNEVVRTGPIATFGGAAALP